jgi:hypothetical protein
MALLDTHAVFSTLNCFKTQFILYLVCVCKVAEGGADDEMLKYTLYAL